MAEAINNNFFNKLNPIGPNCARCAPSARTGAHAANNIADDRVSLSEEALEKSRAAGKNRSVVTHETDLSEADREAVRELKKSDAEVKAHERAHMAAGGGVVQGGATYQYQTGPDGHQYAVGGEVSIDASPEGSPEATIRKMQQVQKAALAPAQPSPTDRAVAAQAAQLEAKARMQKSQESDANGPAADANVDPIADADQRSPDAPHPYRMNKIDVMA